MRGDRMGEESIVAWFNLLFRQ